MSDTPTDANPLANASREQIMSGLFANMVMQQANMALMFLGKVPHPESGETVRDLEMAQLFIDQLEMLEAKTKGNLDNHEQNILQQSLMAVRMAFVEAVQKPAAETESKAGKQAQAQPAPKPEQPAATEAQPATPRTPGPAPEAESHKKFSKKY